jgi:hypothetical protein
LIALLILHGWTIPNPMLRNTITEWVATNRLIYPESDPQISTCSGYVNCGNANLTSAAEAESRADDELSF